jgi:hypothetical protein
MNRLVFAGSSARRQASNRSSAVGRRFRVMSVSVRCWLLSVIGTSRGQESRIIRRAYIQKLGNAAGPQFVRSKNVPYFDGRVLLRGISVSTTTRRPNFVDIGYSF